MLQAAAAYQSPKARLDSARAGAAVAIAPETRRADSAPPARPPPPPPAPPARRRTRW
jgi:hypothetical protein